MTDLKGENDSNTTVAGDFSIPLSIMDRTSRQKISKETVDLNNAIDQMDLKDILRTFHPIAECTFFSSALKTFSRLNHKWSHKTSLNKFKKIE